MNILNSFLLGVVSGWIFVLIYFLWYFSRQSKKSNKQNYIEFSDYVEPDEEVIRRINLGTFRDKYGDYRKKKRGKRYGSSKCNLFH